MTQLGRSGHGRPPLGTVLPGYLGSPHVPSEVALKFTYEGFV